MLSQLKERAQALIQRHGAEVGVVAKIAAHALVPGAPMIIGATEALCDFVSDQSNKSNQSDAMIAQHNQALNTQLMALGDDVKQLDKVLRYMTSELDQVMGQMTQMAQFGTPPEALEAMLCSTLESQFRDLRDELRALTPELNTVKQQGERVLAAQALHGDMLRQVQDQLDVALSFNEPLASEGVVGPQVGIFLGARGRFQSALISGDLSAAERSLDQMRSISPHGNTLKISEMALRAARRDFSGAEAVARSIHNVDDPRLKRALTSLTSLTRAGGKRLSSSPSSSPSPQQRSPDAGDTIGARRWELTSLLGRGGMGEVWRATNSRRREGALKLMNADLSADQSFVNRFQAEIDALDRVSHPAVIDILDWGQDQVTGAWYFVMPFIEGMSLRAKISREGISEEELKSIALTLADGLIACHAAGVIHRDIKPENIMLTVRGEPVLIDFGIAHQEGQSSGHTTMATGGYAPPEQLAGRSVDATADLYALGMTLAECLGSKSREEVWSAVIAQLTHFAPERRGTAESLKALLSEAPARYHVATPGQNPQGPLSAPEVAKLIIAKDQPVMLWWPEATGWTPWAEVEEVSAAVKRARMPKAPTPPPLPSAMTPPPMPVFQAEESPNKAPEPPAEKPAQPQEAATREDWDDATLDELSAAAQRGNVYAQTALGLRYDRSEGVEQDHVEAVRWFREAAELGYARAQCNLGICYAEGEGVEQDYEEAVKWYRKAAEQGYADAQGSLGHAYYSGKGIEQDYEQAVRWYRKVAEQGSARAQDTLGDCYAEGRGVEQNYEEAVKWYRKAAEQGYADAQGSLGYAYYSGEGVEQDYEEAVKWYRKVAEQGYAQAQYSLGICYANGEGVAQNSGEAARWFRKAAEQGDADAQYNLGVSYDEGAGVEQDHVEAAKWYSKAAEQGHEGAQKQLAELVKTNQTTPSDKAGDLTSVRAKGTEFKIEESHSIRENYMTAIRLVEDAIDYGMLDSIDEAYALIDMGVTGKNTLKDSVGLNKAQIRALESMPKPLKIDQNQQKRMVLLVKSLKVCYDVLVASHNNPDPSLSEAVSDLQDSIKKLDVQHNVFFDVQRKLISAISDDCAKTHISRLLKTVRGCVSNVREIAYAMWATHVMLSKIKNIDLQESKDIFDSQRVGELRALTDATTLIEVIAVSIKESTDAESKDLIKSIEVLAKIYGLSLKTASDSTEVQGLLKSLKENRESGASLPDILREQNRLIEEAQAAGNLDTSIVEVIKALNEAKVLVTDTEHKTDIGGELGLTREQEDAMLCEGRTIISAGAGSGKTRVISGKIAYLINKEKADPYSIIACSFSKKSAQDLQSKVQSITGRSLKNIKYTAIGRTTHSIAGEFVSRFDPFAGVKKGVDERSIHQFLQKAIKLVKQTTCSGLDPLNDSFWSEEVVLMSTKAERDDIRILSMIYIVESRREKQGYEKGKVSAVILNMRESYTKYGPMNIDSDDIKLVNSILGTKRGKEILVKAFGGDKIRIDNYQFPSASSISTNIQTTDPVCNSQDDGLQKPDSLSSWWGAHGEYLRFPSIKKCQLFITKCKANMLSPCEAWNTVYGKGDEFEMLAKVYGAYQYILNENNSMDFDDVLIRATRLLSYAINLDEVRAQYKHIMVDEAQDLNPVQHAFFGMIAGTYSAKNSSSKPVPVKAPVATQGTSFTLIGDENQSIYGFRGATSQEFTSKSKTNQGAFDLMSIGLNFRSGENIVNAANRLASKGLGLSCVASFKGSQDSIKHERKKNANESARSLASDIKTAITSSVQTSTPSDFGIACRTNAEVIPYALALLEQDIPFVSGVNPFDHTSTKSIIRVMGAASSDASLRMSALFNSWRDFGYDFPSSFNGKTLGKLADSFKVRVEDLPDHLMDQIDEGNEDDFYTLLGALGIDSEDEKKHEVYKYLEMLAHWAGEGTARPKEAFDIALGYKPIYEGNEDFYVEGPDGKKLHEILASKVRKSETELLGKMVSDEDAEIEPSIGSEDGSEGVDEDYNLAPLPALRSLFNKHESVQEALDKIKTMKVKSQGGRGGFVKASEDVVVLDTVHGWKGLEVPNLYVPMIEGKFPSDKVEFDPIVHADEAQAQAEKAEQEQKLAYVAVTRGMKSVTVLSYEQNEKGEDLEPSEFIAKMGL